MWTALRDGEFVDLRRVAAAERVSMHEDRSIDWRCRGCKGRAHMRRHPDAVAVNFEAFDDCLAPFITLAHHPGQAEICRAMGFHTDESTAHYTLKGMLAKAATIAGWDAEIEVPADGCRADVVVSKDGKSQVLEAQLAALHTADAILRTERYVQAFGPTTWIHTKRRDWAMKIPSLRIDDDDNTVVIRGIKIDGGEKNAAPRRIHDVVAQRLDGRLEWVFDREFGFFRDKTDLRATRPRPRERSVDTERGAYVRECVRPGMPVFQQIEERSEPTLTIEHTAKPASDTRSIKVDVFDTSEWTEARWKGAARMARARAETGDVLNSLDREALQRAPT